MLALILMLPNFLQVVELPTAAMWEYGEARPPRGHVEFCIRVPAECAAYAEPNKIAAYDATHMEWLETINRMVNTEIAPATDMEQYGVPEYWAIPITKGDGEDYALLKRQLLVALGWPASSLLVTAVRMANGDDHAVLTARTTSGDFILDNQDDTVRRWWRTGYRFLARQSSIDPERWVALSPAYIYRDCCD